MVYEITAHKPLVKPDPRARVLLRRVVQKGCQLGLRKAYF